VLDNFLSSLRDAPSWIKIAAVVWAVFGVMLGGIIFLQPKARLADVTDTQPTTKQRGVESPTPKVTSVPATYITVSPNADRYWIDVDAYVNKIASLVQDFKARDSFVLSSNGKSVTWSGAVREINRGSKTVNVHVGSSGGNSFMAVFPQADLEKLYLLRAGDSVIVSGILASTDSRTFWIENATIERK
jgi:hypothetical protein